MADPIQAVEGVSSSATQLSLLRDRVAEHRRKLQKDTEAPAHPTVIASDQADVAVQSARLATAEASVPVHPPFVLPRPTTPRSERAAASSTFYTAASTDTDSRFDVEL